MELVSITTFYRFLTLTDAQVQTLRSELESLASREAIRGLCLLGSEGINATVSGPIEGIERLKESVRAALGSDIIFKDSTAEKHPFSVFKVKIKYEIVTLGNP